MPTDTRAAARDYLSRRGWKVLPLASGRKECLIKGWSRRNFGPNDFGPGDNIGVQFGSASGGLCDVDLDSVEARAVGPLLLPATETVFGRASSPSSHCLYRSNLWQRAKTAARKFQDPVRASGEGQEHGICLVELRVGRVDKNQNPVGVMSMVPPSMHPSGERVCWERDGEPTQVDGVELEATVSSLAAAALLVRHYPATGRRHDAALVLGGFLARAGWNEDRIARFAEAVARAAQDDEWQERVNTAKGAVGAMQAGTEVAGLPRLREVFGDAVADTAAKWLGVQPSAAAMSQDERIRKQIAELARLNKIDYDRNRDDAAKQLRVRKATLDEEVEKQRAEHARQATAAPPPNLGELAALSAEIIACEDVLTLFAQDVGRHIAGEAKIAKLLYLAGTSRLFDKAMHAAIKGPSSGGKSEVRTRVLEYFPPEDVISFTSMSERALLYGEDDFQHKILSMGEAISGEELKFQDYLLRELMSENVLRYPVAQKVGGQIITKVIEKHGPVCFMVTTTRNKLNPENETRMLSLEVNDSEAQTKAVMRKVAEAEGYNVSTREVDFRPFHNFQRWLAAGERVVIIPFARTLVRLIPPRAVRLRRDVGQLLRAIKAHALLHRQHRRRDDDGAVLATIDEDYAAVLPLLGDLLATTAEVKVRAAITDTIEAVKDKQPTNNKFGATAREVANALKIDRTAAWRRLRQAEDTGYVVNVEERRGHPGQYRTTDESPPNADMLPTPEQLRDAIRSSRRTPRNSAQQRNTGT
jgi:hypothetical protein